MFGPPRSGSVRERSESGSFYHQAKIVRKTLISTKQDLDSELNPQVHGTDPRIRIRTKMLRILNTVCKICLKDSERKEAATHVLKK